MAVFFDATSDYLYRVAGSFPDLTDDHTVMVWVKLDPPTPTGGGTRTILVFSETIAAWTDCYLWIGTVADTDTLDWGYWNGTTWVGASVHPTLPLGVWTHLALVRNGSSYQCYINATLTDTVPGAFDTAGFSTISAAYLGNDWEGAWSSLDVTLYRLWTAALTPDEIAAEMGSATYRRIRQLLVNTPLLVHTNLQDTQPLYNGWTASGTLSTSGGPFVLPGVGSLRFTGRIPIVGGWRPPAARTLTLSGRPPTVRVSQRTPGTRALVLTGHAPIVLRSDDTNGVRVSGQSGIDCTHTTGWTASQSYTVMGWFYSTDTMVSVCPTVDDIYGPNAIAFWPSYVSMTVYGPGAGVWSAIHPALTVGLTAASGEPAAWEHHAVTFDRRIATQYLSTQDRTTFDVGIGSQVDFPNAEHVPNVIAISSGPQSGFKHIRAWSAVLTPAEIRAERDSATAVRTSDLYLDVPFTSPLSITDTSGADHNFTFTYGTSWLIPWTPDLVIPATVTVVTTVPSSYHEETTGVAGSDYISWYEYTAQASDPPLLGCLAFATIGTDHRPEVAVFAGSRAAPYPWPLTQGDALRFVRQRPIEIPLTPGQTYYIRITSGATTVISVDTDVSFTWPSNVAETIPEGSLLITDDTDSFPLVFLDDTAGAIQRFVWETRAADKGCSLPNGYLCLQHGLDMPWPNFVGLYNPTFDLIAAPQQDDTLLQISQNGNETFYIASSNYLSYPGYSIISTLTTAGVFTHARWVIPALTSLGGDGQYVQALAPSWDNTILYYHGYNTAIHRWDLIANQPLTDLAPVVTGASSSGADMLVLSDQSIIVARTFSFTSWTAYHYAPDGTLLHTYPFLEERANRMCAALDDPLSFWAWSYVSLGGSRFRRIQVSDGSVLNEFDVQDFTAGAGPLYDPYYPAGDPPAFGHSNSCSLIILREAWPAPPPEPPAPVALVTSRQIRRLRRAQHLTGEGLWAFYTRFQLDLESGVGPTSGLDPQLMLRWSDDGGHTWSDEHWVSAGPVGQYGRRAIWRRLGRSRDRVFEVTISDPVKVAWIDAWVDLAPGTS